MAWATKAMTKLLQLPAATAQRISNRYNSTQSRSKGISRLGSNSKPKMMPLLTRKVLREANSNPHVASKANLQKTDFKTDTVLREQRCGERKVKHSTQKYVPSSQMLRCEYNALVLFFSKWAWKPCKSWWSHEIGLVYLDSQWKHKPGYWKTWTWAAMNLPTR